MTARFLRLRGRDLQLVIDASETKVDLLAGRRELDRVREDVADDLLQSRGVGVDDIVSADERRLEVRRTPRSAASGRAFETAAPTFGERYLAETRPGTCRR